MNNKLKSKKALLNQIGKKATAAPTEERQLTQEKKTKYVNKQRVLILASRGITSRGRHLLLDFEDLLPQFKTDIKLDIKRGFSTINEIADIKNCNTCLFFETRKHQDVYLWASATEQGPSVKFLVQNLYTTEELKLVGNCMKGSRHILVFDNQFETKPQWKLIKELFKQIYAVPKGHPKSKPFVDHVLSFFIVDNRIWVRNYQIKDKVETEKDVQKLEKKGENCELVEIGPRFCLNPIRIFKESFAGQTLYQNPMYISPNEERAIEKKKKGGEYLARQKSIAQYNKKMDQLDLPADQLAEVFE
ncbi:hypothetical protein WA158_000824 [Blastocystis sp. Blastoise]